METNAAGTAIVPQSGAGSLARFRPSQTPPPEGQLVRRSPGTVQPIKDAPVVPIPRPPAVVQRLPRPEKRTDEPILAVQAAKVGESAENLMRHPAFTNSLIGLTLLGLGYAADSIALPVA